ncbi:cytochrome P450 [Schizopora paradoxa]|uniref:Cytochrome P450 n=1 Tax=Schizopora paradoxa TaxID=27342 RepID=A0A0H2RYP6_9AGAM|nr:cytochrome P450 [Schizopora paradoxa]
MSFKMLVSICAIAISFLVVRVLQRRSTLSKRLPYPPGPKRLPIVGNFFQILSRYLWESAVEWGKEYGDLIYLENIGQRILVVNSYEDAKELLVRRSAITSSRPHFTMTIDLEHWDWNTTFVPYGENFRKHRSHQQRFIGSPETLDYMDVQLTRTRETMKAILDDPEEYGAHIQSLPGSVILLNVYGHQVEKNDPYVDIGKLGVYYTVNSQSYLFLDVLPWLKFIPEWFPWVDFPRVAREARKVAHAMRYELYEPAKEKNAQGTLKECMMSMYLSENTREDGSILDEDSFSAAAATLYLGGVDTSNSALMTFFLQMLKNREKQRLAQKEIDEVVGTDRLPTFDDMDHLPYVRGVCAEILRMAVVLPLGKYFSQHRPLPQDSTSTIVISVPPHYTTEDDEYKGYLIPAGTIIFANSWAMAFNPIYFPEPHEFKPERWLSQFDEKSCEGPRPNDFLFGFGRRACPGQDWGEKMLFIAVVSTLATFNIEPAIGEDGNPIAPNEDYTPGFVRQLGPSKCKIAPRSPKAASLIENSVFSK